MVFWKVRCDLLNQGKERDENQFSIYRSFQVGKRPAVEEWHYHWLPIQLLVVVSSDNIHNYHVEVINCKLSYTLSISAKFYLVFVEKCSEKKKTTRQLELFFSATTNCYYIVIHFRGLISNYM